MTSSQKTTNLYQGRKAPLTLNIVIVGCGLGGLAAAYCLGQAGHHVAIFETAPTLDEIGAGIQVGPNLTRLLVRWGLGEQLRKTAVMPEAFCFRRCQSRVAYNHYLLTLKTDYRFNRGAIVSRRIRKSNGKGIRRAISSFSRTAFFFLFIPGIWIIS
jgi:hypothetical protein